MKVSRKRIIGWPLLLVATFGLSFAAGANPLDLLKKLPFMGASFDVGLLKKEFHRNFYETGTLPTKLKIDKKDYQLSYTVRPELEEAVAQILRKYRPEFTSVVVIDNNNGHVLAALDMARGDTRPHRLSTFAPTHPAASIFKIVTAADLLENTHVGNETQFQFAGRSTTLYKYQLKQSGGRWSRRTDFEHAFARSNNVIFGKAALDNLSPTGLKKMAEKFGFNKDIVPFAQAEQSTFPMAADQYNLAELASGLNRSTMISPVHGAMIASVIANGGIMKKPILLKRVEDSDENVIWEPTPQQEMVIAPETSEDLRKMMIATVLEGTARRAFRRLPSSLRDIEVAGKTGSITGGEPFGKRDWFVAYARNPNKPEDRGVSLCVMIVNKKKWYVKSTQLTREILEMIWGTSQRSSSLRRKIWKSRT
ncbi:MAG: penicillin-binding transpeptidase domain-containing protein [Bacteriovoracia bacterium]